jgi:hypothetical protein
MTSQRPTIQRATLNEVLSPRVEIPLGATPEVDFASSSRQPKR